MRFFLVAFFAVTALALAPASAAESGDVKAVTDSSETTEIEKKLREYLDELLGKVGDAIENAKVVTEDFIQKLKELRQKIKEAKVDIGKKAKDLLEQLKEKAKDWWKKILDKLRPED